MKMAIVITFLLVLSGHALASRPAIYGQDNRVDTFASPSDLFQELAQKTAALVDRDNIRMRGQNAELLGPSLGEFFKLCSNERFFHQPFVATCSGFLVAPDIIATAGHCFESKDRCTRYDWVFNFKVDHEKQSHVTVDASDVYRCKEIISKGLVNNSIDYALIRLDRAVPGIAPVKLATSFEVGTPLVMIGHPSGLPQKIADQAVIKSISATEFKANLDAFQINSGSGVFNARSGELLGILVRGVVDYKNNPQRHCTEVHVLKDGPGEDISKNTQFANFLK